MSELLCKSSSACQDELKVNTHFLITLFKSENNDCKHEMAANERSIAVQFATVIKQKKKNDNVVDAFSIQWSNRKLIKLIVRHDV
jgi:hypothetical protein